MQPADNQDVGVLENKCRLDSGIPGLINFTNTNLARNYSTRMYGLNTGVEPMVRPTRTRIYTQHT